MLFRSATLDLASRACPVRYIITVQALREGWDCPFAYVLCSVQTIRSATAVELCWAGCCACPMPGRAPGRR